MITMKLQGVIAIKWESQIRVLTIISEFDMDRKIKWTVIVLCFTFDWKKDPSCVTRVQTIKFDSLPRLAL